MASFFKSLFGASKKEPDYGHWVWTTGTEKLKGMMERLQKHTGEGRSILLLAWFPKSLQELEYLLTNLNVPYNSGINNHGTAKVTIDLADNYLKRITGPYAVDAVWLVEHFPIHEPEVALFERLAHEVPSVKPIVLTSLDEKLFTLFGSDRIKEVMKSLGYSAGDVLEHSMIRKSVVRAQEKVAESAIGNSKATSDEEWFSLNYRKR